jgi:hypothetical protein
MSAVTKKGILAVSQPQFKKVEAELKGGIAVIAQRINLIKVDLVLGYNFNGTELTAGDKIILRGDSGLQPWAKQVVSLDNKEFVLCPEDQILGYEKA